MYDAFPHITPIALKHRLQSDLKATLLDVRSLREYLSGHIPGAQSAPMEALNGRNIETLTHGAGLDKDNPLYLTCFAGLRAKQAAQILRNAGLQHIMIVAGGTEGWKKAGLPLEQETQAASQAGAQSMTPPSWRQPQPDFGHKIPA